MYTEVRVEQVSGDSKDLDQCIEEFDYLRGGQGLLSCRSDDTRMIDQLTWLCEDFIKDRQPHFDWSEMKIVLTTISEEY
tara:strand:- start:651 stop:887 length:237 start_codon:yes stop_codon:yes gene_type:complete